MNQTEIADVFAAIAAERDHQDGKHGAHQRSVGDWMILIELELNEAKLAYGKSKGNTNALIELVQVAATAVACLQQHGAPSRAEADS